ncbi:hypothetical protein pipiens_005321 [Culex pipiens pipiens]|uniref:Uncharacterized protein n=1 Tax=Culex pipiens pipiens TaxID=38569 RepID=A0ABD1DXZ4_CULPP
MEDFKTAAAVLVFVYIFSPLLRNLTDSVSMDTITFLVLMLHLIFYDHCVPAAIVSKGITLNAAIFGAICLTARAILAVSRSCSVGSGRRGLRGLFGTSEPLYKLLAQVVGDVDTTLAELNIRVTKEEESLLRLIWNLFIGDFCDFLNIGNYQDMLNCDQTAQLMVHSSKIYPTEDCTFFQVLARIMSGTLHAGQEVRVLGVNYSLMGEEDSRTLWVGRLWIYEAR